MTQESAHHVAIFDKAFKHHIYMTPILGGGWSLHRYYHKHVLVRTDTGDGVAWATHGGGVFYGIHVKKFQSAAAVVSYLLENLDRLVALPVQPRPSTCRLLAPPLPPPAPLT